MPVTRLPPDDERPGLKPPRFRIVTLLLFTGLLCAAFAIVATLSPQAMIGFVLLLLCVVAHVAGNALGTQLRKNGDSLSTLSNEERARLFRRPTPQDVAPPTVLSVKRAPGLLVMIITVVGAVAGAGIGGGLLAWANWEQLDATIAVFCFTATGAIGGVAGFGVGSFATVMWSAHRDAMKVSSGK